MGYSKEVYDDAFRILSERKSKAKQTAELRRMEIYDRIPRIRQIDRELSGTGIMVAKAVLAGGSDASQLIEGMKQKNISLQQEKAQLLRENGYAVDYLEIPYSCAACQDEGYIGNEKCDCLQQLLKAQAIKRLQGTVSADEASFEQFRLEYYPDQPDAKTGVNPRKKMGEIFGYCQQYCRAFYQHAPNILMIGATGLGKTHLSIAIASEITRRGYGVVYSSMQNLMNRMEKERFSRVQAADADTLQTVLDCDLLILDDLGSEFQTTFTVSALYNIINTRLNEQRPVIINTNLNMNELLKVYNERIVSRILGNYDVLKFFGNDIRQIKMRGRLLR
ncbi:ATP-binding protein [Candidatus Soleaferrea massiliensis]|uniref:ATP-binding protein n=1 Tax=Candidatus Soleaferrea massiliensis TaxID=1470354 RepID=UPI00058BDD8B|nr:ATP-binding protein [Candidatus Soleaferrea massiliensis]